MATPDGGLAAAAYGPSEVRTTVGGNIPVTITEDTDYPFRGKIILTVNPERTATWPLVVRIPAWAAGAQITVAGRRSTVAETGWRRIERRWRAGDRVEIEFPMAVRTSRWFNDSLAFERGPLVFSLKIGEDWRKLREVGPATDWEVHPTTPWNYAVIPGSAAETQEKAVGEYPFSPEGAPVELKVRGRKLPAWELVNGSAATVPPSPVKSAQPIETLTLIPYGSAKLRITAFPVLEK
jgi:DUF1680 family protein